MYGILAESASDADSLKAIVRGILGDQSTRIRTADCKTCSKLVAGGAREIRALADLGYKWIIICHDADGPSDRVAGIHKSIMEKVIGPTGLKEDYAIVIPVQEIEAWMVADEEAIHKVFKGWKPKEESNPEKIQDPKEYLTSQSKGSNKKPRYDYTTHNPRIARHLRFEVVEAKCPSFKPLADFVRRMGKS